MSCVSFKATARVTTEDGYEFYVLNDGRVVDNLDEDCIDQSYDCIEDLEAEVDIEVDEF